MELNVISTHDNKAIGRKEIEFSVLDVSGTKRDAVKVELCKKANLDPKATIIVRINNSFGSMATTGTAHSYTSEEALKRYESRHLLERLGIVPKAANANAPSPSAAAAPATAPAAASVKAEKAVEPKKEEEKK
jgi:small subunit ribosomal protein S24e